MFKPEVVSGSIVKLPSLGVWSQQDTILCELLDYAGFQNFMCICTVDECIQYQKYRSCIILTDLLTYHKIPEDIRCIVVSGLEQTQPLSTHIGTTIYINIDQAARKIRQSVNKMLSTSDPIAIVLL